jgi:hypothetical protein
MRTQIKKLWVTRDMRDNELDGAHMLQTKQSAEVQMGIS